MSEENKNFNILRGLSKWRSALWRKKEQKISPDANSVYWVRCFLHSKYRQHLRVFIFKIIMLLFFNGLALLLHLAQGRKKGSANHQSKIGTA